ncbi:uncharacterized protein LOC111706097, partial [Eurytemora carolleeae]|uniref:uncharacterized protein LOC111706097 n=1 Tax=Eurytemora carolleeae TaxID=1294199 RepID=UPI000C78D9ED
MGKMRFILWGILLSILSSSFILLTSAQSQDDLENKRIQCGIRFAEFSSNSSGIEGGREVEPAQLSAPTQAFPWLVKVVVISPILEVVCAGVILSPTLVLAPAHCLRGIPTETLRILVGQDRENSSSIHDVAYHLENVILHPDYNSTAGDSADLAVVKLEPRRDTGPIQFSNYSTPACLNLQPKPSASCQVAGWAVTTQGQESLRSAVVGHEVHLKSTQSCTGESTGILDSGKLICSSERCNRFVSGPVFCGSGSSYELTGLPGSSSSWCTAGAYTRVAHYSSWIQKTMAYLDSDYVSLEADIVENDEDQAEGEGEFACANDPCGEGASCWNGQEGSFLCTCDTKSLPKGNPYRKCVQCVYTNDCPSGQECKDEKCTGQDEKVPDEFVQVGNNYYIISDDSLPWLQAQYYCMNKQGHLVELVNKQKTDELQAYLISRHGGQDFWVGASDLDAEGTFRWFYSGAEFSKELWADQQTKNSSHHCVKLNEDQVKFSAFSCDAPQHYVCEYMPDIYLPAGENGLSHAEGRARSFDTLNPNAHHSQICGRKFVRNGRIVGGGVASYGEWPWQVSLRQYKNGQFKHKCGAALLTADWIITAAHCVKDIAASNLMVRIGEYHVLNRNEAHPHIDRRVRKVVTHKLFDKFTYEYDIALLQVHGDKLDFQPNIIPVCLPENNNNLVGEQAWVTGWGRLSEYGQISPVLREVSLPIISNSQCMKMYRSSGQNEWIPKIFICAGTSTGGEDSCEGDSGGPLVVQGKDGRWQLAGIISWGIGCGD